MVRTKILPSSVTLTLSLPVGMFLNGTCTRDGEQLCQIILKSIHNCRSYGPDKFGRMDARTHRHTDARTYTEVLL